MANLINFYGSVAFQILLKKTPLKICVTFWAVQTMFLPVCQAPLWSHFL